MAISDDIRRIEQRQQSIDAQMHENREDMQAVSRQLAQLEKEFGVFQAGHAATARASNEDRQAMRAEINRLNGRFDDIYNKLDTHIKSVDAYTNQLKGAGQAGLMIVRILRWTGIACIGAVVWIYGARDYIANLWRVLNR